MRNLTTLRARRVRWTNVVPSDYLLRKGGSDFVLLSGFFTTGLSGVGYWKLGAFSSSFLSFYFSYLPKILRMSVLVYTCQFTYMHDLLYLYSWRDLNYILFK